ncbi:MAG: hypothetical protein ACI9MR_002896 [Myxococcota bacterium]
MGTVPAVSSKPNPPNPSDSSSDPASNANGPKRGFFGRVSDFLHRHKALMWWGHSIYALGLGVMVILFAAKGFEHARILAATLGAAFLLLLLLFRLFGHGDAQREKVEEKRSAKVRFVLMTYVLKNLYQGMLFFLLPFYWNSSTIDSMNGWFVFVLGVLAFISTMDIIFDHLLMRYRMLAATFYTMTLFACMNLVIPALFPNVRTIVTLMTSAALAVLGFSLLHFPMGSFKEKRRLIYVAVAMVAFAFAVFFARVAIPPVPLYVMHAAVGPAQLADGRLALEVGRLHYTLLDDMIAVTDVALPGGEGDAFRHVWRYRDGDFRLVVEATRRSSDRKNGARLVSTLRRDQLPDDIIGDWTVDVVTIDDQIVGRARFTVIE